MKSERNRAPRRAKKVKNPDTILVVYVDRVESDSEQSTGVKTFERRGTSRQPPSGDAAAEQNNHATWHTPEEEAVVTGLWT